MRMLSRDNDVFYSRFYEASAFLMAADLRYECYVLACMNPRNQWQETRLTELLRCPACREQWFVIMLRGDGDIEETIIAAGA